MAPVPKWRLLKMGLATIFGFKRQGFFIPYRYADKHKPARERSSYDALVPLFLRRKTAFLDFIQIINLYKEEIDNIGKNSPPGPRWRQVWFPRLDGVAAYSMVRHYQPERIVEVGSGHSTRFMAQAVTDGGLNTRITAIDPAPRATIGELNVDLILKPVEEAGAAPFDELTDGDILFIDSSHILMPGSDVDYLFNCILPVLPPGVLIHIHDIFLPDDYPVTWEWRGYNEQQGVAGLLQGNGYEILFASHYVASRMAAELENSIVGKLELPDGAVESSLWLRKI